MNVQTFKRQLARPDLIPWNLTHPTSSSSSFSVGNETVWPSRWPALAAVENRGLVTHGKCWQGRHWLIDPLERGVRAVRSIAFKVLPNASCRLWTTGMLQILEWCSLSKKWSKRWNDSPDVMWEMPRWEDSRGKSFQQSHSGRPPTIATFYSERLPFTFYLFFCRETAHSFLRVNCEMCSGTSTMTEVYDWNKVLRVMQWRDGEKACGSHLARFYFFYFLKKMYFNTGHKFKSISSRNESV